MGLSNAFKTAKGKVAKTGLAATMSLAVSGAALANDNNVHQVSLDSMQQCAPLEINKAGRTLDAGLSAYRYSKNDAGAVGISIFPGSNIPTSAAHEFGTKLRTAFLRNGVDAECFVHNEIGPNGTGINFDIDGLSWSEDGPLNIREAKDINTLKGVATEARLVRATRGGQEATTNNNVIKSDIEPIQVIFVSDVDKALIDWGRESPNDIAIGAKLGEDVPVSVDRITSKIYNAVQKACPRTKTKFIFENVSGTGSVFSLMYDGKLDRNVRPSRIAEIAEAAAEHLCTTRELLGK